MELSKGDRLVELQQRKDQVFSKIVRGPPWAVIMLLFGTGCVATLISAAKDMESGGELPMPLWLEIGIKGGVGGGVFATLVEGFVMSSKIEITHALDQEIENERVRRGLAPSEACAGRIARFYPSFPAMPASPAMSPFPAVEPRSGDSMVPVEGISGVHADQMYEMVAVFAFCLIAITATIICRVLDVSLEQAPLWVKVVYYGGLVSASLTLGKMMVFAIVKMVKLACIASGIHPISSIRKLIWKGYEALKQTHWKSADEDASVDESKKIEGDRLAYLQHKVKTWTFPGQNCKHAGMVFSAVGSIALIVRWYKGWSEEELGLPYWLSLFGGYSLGVSLQGWSMLLDYMSSRDLDKTVAEIKRERALRGLEPRAVGEQAGEKAGELDESIC